MRIIGEKVTSWTSIDISVVHLVQLLPYSFGILGNVYME